MPWLQIHLITEQERAHLVALLFENLGALSVTLGDAEDSPLFEPAPGEQPVWSRTRVTGLFPGDTDTDSLRQRINQALNREVTGDISLEILKDQVWERTWLDGFQPMRFGRRLWICPDGRRPEGESGISSTWIRDWHLAPALTPQPHSAFSGWMTTRSKEYGFSISAVAPAYSLSPQSNWGPNRPTRWTMIRRHCRPPTTMG